MYLGPVRDQLIKLCLRLFLGHNSCPARKDSRCPITDADLRIHLPARNGFIIVHTLMENAVPRGLDGNLFQRAEIDSQVLCGVSCLYPYVTRRLHKDRRYLENGNCSASVCGFSGFLHLNEAVKKKYPAKTEKRNTDERICGKKLGPFPFLLHRSYDDGVNSSLPLLLLQIGNCLPAATQSVFLRIGRSSLFSIQRNNSYYPLRSLRPLGSILKTDAQRKRLKRSTSLSLSHFYL